MTVSTSSTSGGVSTVSTSSTSDAGSTSGRLGNPVARSTRLGIRRIGYEVKAYFRQGDAVFFTFLFPVMMLAIFSTAFSETGFGVDADGNDVTAGAFYLPAMLAAGGLLSGLQNMARDIAMEERDGTLKGLSGTPFPV